MVTAHAYQLLEPQWPQPSTTFTVDIAGADGLWNDAFETAMYLWGVDTVFKYYINRGEYSDPCDPFDSRNGVGFNSSYCGDSWGATTLAITSYWYVGTTLTETDIVFNSNKAWNVYSSPWLYSPNDFQRVAVHELGHALGLDHEDSGIPSIMTSYADDAIVPLADDIAGVSAIYGPATVSPPASIIVPASDPDGSYTLSWTASDTSGASYVLQEARNSSFTDTLRTAYSGSALSAVISGRSNNLTYYYRIKAVASGYYDSAWVNGDNGCVVTLPSPVNDNTEFVKQVYRDFLNREPDAGGLTYWVAQIEAGTFDRSELVEQYLLSAEFGEAISPVVRLYFTYYLRIPDYDGLMFWVKSYAAGMSLNDISDAFATAQEFIDRYGSLTNETFISQMYVNVYGRQPDAGGLAYWTGMLDTAALTRGQVMVFFSSAEEYMSISANQVYVTMTYMGLLRRAPDQDGFTYWVSIMDGGASGLALIDAFLFADEYQGRFDGTWVISSLSITGPLGVEENSSTIYSAVATWADGRTSMVSALWSANSAYASIDNVGTLTAFDVNSDTDILLYASFTSGGVTRNHSIIVEIINAPKILSGLTINGPTSVNENGTANYTATASWSDGSTSTIVPIWSENSEYASISGYGTLATSTVNNNQIVTISANYTFNGITRSDTHNVTILNNDTGPSFTELTVGVSHNLYINAFATDIYKFTAPVSSRYRIALTNTHSDLSWALADNYEIPATILAECDNSFYANDEICITSTTLTGGGTYYIGIDEWDSVAGTYTLRIDPQ